MPKSAQKSDKKSTESADRMRADGLVNLVSEPGAITIEATGMIPIITTRIILAGVDTSNIAVSLYLLTGCHHLAKID